MILILMMVMTVSGKERWSMFMLKSHLMPHLYWHGLVKGWWEGPGLFRKLFSFGLR